VLSSHSLNLKGSEKRSGSASAKRPFAWHQVPLPICHCKSPAFRWTWLAAFGLSGQKKSEIHQETVDVWLWAAILLSLGKAACTTYMLRQKTLKSTTPIIWWFWYAMFWPTRHVKRVLNWVDLVNGKFVWYFVFLYFCIRSNFFHKGKFINLRQLHQKWYNRIKIIPGLCIAKIHTTCKKKKNMTTYDMSRQTTPHNLIFKTEHYPSNTWTTNKAL
jgi:hypothetical protein